MSRGAEHVPEPLDAEGGARPRLEAQRVAGEARESRGAEAGTRGDVSGSIWHSAFFGPGLDGYVYATAVWDDGRGPALYVGGDFVTAGEERVNSIARWDGNAWEPLGGPAGVGLSGWTSGAPTRVLALAVHNGSLVVGGNFTEAGGVTVNHIARWDGSEWSAIEGQTGSGLSGHVQALVSHDGDLYVGGLFTQAGGDVRASWVTRWDGNAWSPLVGSTPTGLDAHLSGTVAALAVQDGDLVVAGGFLAIAHWNGVDWVDQVFAGGIARWDGDDWSTLTGGSGTGTSSFVFALAPFDGDLIVGGIFEEAGGIPAARIARWDGGEWSPLGSGVSGGLASVPHVNALTVFGGELIVGGHFTEAGGTAAVLSARWNGSAWAPMLGSGGAGLSGGPMWATVATLAVFDGAVVAGGQFAEADGQVVNQFAFWDGTAWAAPVTPGGFPAGSSIQAAALYEGDLIVAGNFERAGLVQTRGIARWDGTQWWPLAGPSGEGVSGEVSALAVFNGELIVGGNILEAGGVPVERIARWNGTEWSAPGGGVGGAFSPRVASLFVYDGVLIVGGDFTEAGGVAANNIARWDGVEWSALGDGVGGGPRVVLALAEYGGDLFAGGSFTQAEGTTVNRIARWDGSQWWPLTGSSGTGLNFNVSDLAVFDGNLMVAGGFNQAGGISTRGLAGWTGSEWFAIGPAAGTFSVGVLAPFDGALVAGGSFTEVAGEPFNRIARWDGETWSPLAGPFGEGVTGAPFGSSVSALLAVGGGGPSPVAGRLVVGGVFLMTGGLPNWNLGVYGPSQLPGAAVIPVDDGVVEVAADGLCSLVEAFENAANGDGTHADCEPGSATGNTIELWPEAVYTLTEIHNGSQGPTGLPAIGGQVLVEGNGAIVERSSATPPFRLLYVAPGGALELQDLTLRGGSLGMPGLAGAGIRNDGSLTLTLATLTGHSNGPGIGGAIYNASGAHLLTSRSTLRGNSGGGAGAGLFNAAGGTAELTHSTLSANNCGGEGCGIRNEGQLTLANSTVSSHSGPAGVGIHNSGTLTLDHVTVAGNVSGQGAGLLNDGSATLRNTLFANPDGELDCSGTPPTFEGVNLIEDGSCGCAAPSCLTGDPLLEPLGDNGGPTETHALPAGSLAIEAAGAAQCLADDQRGVARPQGDGCDIGAYEADAVLPQPELQFVPSNLDFGDVEVGTTSPPQTSTLSNDGDADATNLLFTVPGNGFDAGTGDCGDALPAGASCDVVVTFTPSAPGPAAATLEVESAEGAAVALGLAGNGVAADPPVLDADPDSLSSTLPPGGMDTHSLTLANLGGGVLDWEVVEAAAALQRIGAIELPGGEDFVFSSVIDPAGEYAYFGTLTTPGRIVKIDLETFERVGVLTLPAGEGFLDSAVIDPAGAFAYFATAPFPGPATVVKIDLETFQRVDAITLASGENDLRAAVIDPDGAFVYFGTLTVPGQVVKIDLETFQRVGAITLEAGENSLHSAAIDPAGDFAYFGAASSPGRVIKIDLTTFQRVDSITLELGDNELVSAVIDPAGAFAYFGTATFPPPARVVKIDLETFQAVGSTPMAGGEDGLFTAVMDPAGSFAAFGSGQFPARAALLDLDTFAWVDGVTMESGEDTFFTGEIDPAGAFAYFGTFTVPGRVVKVGLGGGCSLPGWVSATPTSGSLPGGASQVVSVTIDAGDLEPGEYEAGLCLASNDPVSPLVTVPVSLTVLDDVVGSVKVTASDGAPSDFFGVAVAIDGDTAVVGADRANVGANNNQGAAYVYVRDGAGWVEQAKLTASDGAAFHQFGATVALSGDVALVGVGHQNADAAYVFVRDGGSWTQQARLTAADSGPGDGFGTAVALDGEVALVGAHTADVDGVFNQGAAYVFVRDGEQWVEQAKLLASDGEQFNLFAMDVALQGDTAVIGAAFHNTDGNNNQGAAYVFVRNGETWIEQAKLVADDGAVEDRFGISVAVDGDTAVLGATQAAIDGSAFQGAAYVFERTGGSSWSQEAKLVAGDGAGGDNFGESVALAGGLAVVGALFHDEARGAAYVFERMGGDWSERQKLTAPDAAPGDQLGKAVDFDGDTALVGAWTADVGANGSQGAAYFFALGAGGPAVIPVDDGVVDIAADGLCSLIEAFENAIDGGGTHADCEPGSPAGNTIELWPTSVYVLTEQHNDSDGPTGLPSVSVQILVQGNGAVIERQSDGPQFRLLHVGAGGELELRDLSLANGALGVPIHSGAGIRNDGTLQLRRVTVRGSGGPGSGGGIFNAPGGNLSLEQSTLQNNGGNGAGAGIYNATGGTATVRYSTLRQNSCGGGGCGVRNDGQLAMTNSTLSGNGGPFAGGIHNIGTLVLDHVTVAASSGNPFSGNNLQNDGVATLRNTMLADAAAADCSGAPLAFEGVNLIEDGSCGCVQPVCLTGDPLLGPIGDNGGLTETHALLEGSVAIDAAALELCAADDQRGVSRPQRDGCDIGAFEAEPAPQPVLAFDPPSLAFGDVEVGTTSPPQLATLHNSGDAEATELGFGSPGSGFAADTSGCGTSLPAGGSCAVSITFTPVAPGAAGATLEASSAEGAMAALGLSGNGVDSAQPILHLDPESLSSTLVAGQAETLPLTIANQGDAPLDWEVTEVIGVLERIDAVELGEEEWPASVAAIHPDGQFAYFAMNSAPGRAVKIDLESFERSGGVTFELTQGENLIRSVAVDPDGAFAYFGSGMNPGRVVKVDLESFERVDALTLGPGEAGLASAAIDPAGQFAYFATGLSQGSVVKIDLATFERVGALPFASGEGSIQSMEIDPAGAFAYFVTATIPGRVVKVDLATFQRVGVLELDGAQGENGLQVSVMDPAGEFLYVGTGIEPLRVVKIHLATFQRIGGITLADGETSISSAVMDPAGEYAYFGTGRNLEGEPAWLVKVALATFTQVDALQMESGDDVLLSGVVDLPGDFAYLGTHDPLARIVKVALRDDCPLPDWVSVVPESGSVPGGEAQVVGVTFDSAGVDPGEYNANLCIASNDPERPVALVPLTLLVEEVTEPELTFEPASLEFGEVEVGSSESLAATLRNTGTAEATGLAFTGLPDGGFEAETGACGSSLPAGGSCVIDATFAPTGPGPAAATLAVTSDQDAAASLALSGHGLVDDTAFAPAALEVDYEPLASDGNEVFEPGESVLVAPAWRNDGTSPQLLEGDAVGFTGPEGASYTIDFGAAQYGLVAPVATASCRDTGICYELSVDDPAARPATLWVAALDEALTDGTTHTWNLHIGDSFTDVPRSSPFYRSIETLLHHEVTGGCSETAYCPTEGSTRGQMPVFVLRALEGPDYVPQACTPDEEAFADVPATSGFCPWIEELVRRQVVAGCGANVYCPNAPVNRQQMAIFLLRTLEGPGYTPPACEGRFTDVPCPSPFAAWIEELARREITGGCTATEYCPTAPVNRQQMAVFITQTFGLRLYGP